MYTKIETEFKSESKLRLFQGAVIVFLILTLFLYVWIADDEWFLKNYFLAIALYYIGFFVFIYVFLLICVKGFHRKRFWNISWIVAEYRQKMHRHDIAILKIILEEHGVDSRKKTLEAIRHYQALLPRNVVSNSSWLSVFAVAISVVALVLSDNFLQYESYWQMALVITALILTLYAIYLILNRGIFQLFGAAELYKRLEASISEIYMNMPEETQLSSTTAGKRKRKHRR